MRRRSKAAACRTTAIAFIDKYAFTRECIALSLQAAGADFHIVPHASCADVLNGEMRYDLFLFHWHGRHGEFESSELAAAEFRSVAALGPVVVLGAIEQGEFISSAFEKGVRGYIPIGSTPAGLAVEIIRLVKAGGTFVPLSSLSSRGARIPDVAVAPGAGRALTPREGAVLKLLKQGKANKTIAYELHLSESTVKAHIRHIMRKMKVKNRTEAVCCAYAATEAAAGD
ncbi:MAG TPA: response regulator transcription factor [Stellaceae bacterium]|nr:response regulator transcription factor [Stellaceae bacterium]